MNVTPRKLQSGVTGVGRERAGGVDFGWMSIQRDVSALFVFSHMQCHYQAHPFPLFHFFVGVVCVCIFTP